MSSKLQDITLCISDEMVTFEKMFKDNFFSEDALLNNILAYAKDLKGKRIRPLITFLTAKIFGNITEQTFRSAIIIELLHTASLLHDDVLDNSKLRRGSQTINSLFGDKTAILIGDYIYGKALATLKTKEDFILMDIFSRIALQLPQGEIKETNITTNKDIQLHSYLKVIYYKTACLIKAATECGARTCQNSNLDLDSLALLGENIGIAFQIRDDILDYDINNLTGKGIGNDIREKKITLPFIYYLQTIDDKTKDEMMNLFFSDKKTDNDIQLILGAVMQSGAIDKTVSLQKEYSQKALQTVDGMPLNDYSISLKALVKYLTIRDK